MLKRHFRYGLRSPPPGRVVHESDKNSRCFRRIEKRVLNDAIDPVPIPEIAHVQRNYIPIGSSETDCGGRIPLGQAAMYASVDALHHDHFRRARRELGNHVTHTFQNVGVGRRNILRQGHPVPSTRFRKNIFFTVDIKNTLFKELQMSGVHGVPSVMAIIGWATILFGQTADFSNSGRVLDEAGKPVVNAMVTYENPARRLIYTFTDSLGTFPPGKTAVVGPQTTATEKKELMTILPDRLVVSLAAPQMVIVDLFDCRGRRIGRPIDGLYAKGIHSISFFADRHMSETLSVSLIRARIGSSETVYRLINQTTGAVTYSADGSGIPADADVVVVAVGEDPRAEYTKTDAELSLRQAHKDLIRRAHDSGKPVVCLLFSGGPLLITDEIDQCDAFIAAWFPGTEGDGMGDALFGNNDFAGTLKHTWPRTLAQIPINQGNLGDQTGTGGDPLFPYGYGRNYAGIIKE
jgi:putative intracellular protease/amidase